MHFLTDLKTPSMLSALTPYEREKHVLADMKLANYLRVRLDSIPTNAITTCKTSFQIWTKLSKQYASSNLVTQNRLRDQWAITVQKPAQPVCEWIQEVDNLSESMTTALIPVDEPTKLHRLLRGLSADYAHEKKFFELSRFTYDQACSTLIQIGEQQEFTSSNRQLVPAFSAQTQKKKWSKSSKQPYSCFTCGASDHTTLVCPTGLQPTIWPDGRKAPRCFTCLIEGHTSRYCKKKQSDNGASPSKALAVLHDASVTLPASIHMDKGNQS
jgi:hypothetical protein